jgi:hypothetical protein
MSVANQTANRSTVVGPHSVTVERRNHRHLRELCDEVLASYRAAAGQDLFTATDRTDTRLMMSRISGGVRRSIAH